MGTDSQNLPPIPGVAIVAETVRLATLAEDERYAQRPPEWPEYRCDDLDSFFRPRPAADALLVYLRALPDVTIAGLYAIFRLGDRPYSTPTEAEQRYRTAFELAMQPMHREHGAGDLAAKGPLADGLRRGLAQLGLRIEPAPGEQSGESTPNP